MGLRRQLLAAGAALSACLVLVAVAWVASTGVGPLASGVRPFHFPLPSSTGSTSTQPPFSPPASSNDQGSSTGPDLSWIGLIFEFLVLLTVAGALVWLLVLMVPRNVRWRMPRAPARIEFQEPAVASKLEEELTSAREVHLTRLSEGSPRNGIVQCWMAFEDAAAAVELPPLRAETPTEFLTRLLSHLEIDPRPGVRLANLYHVARFSSHPLGEADREAARQALLDLHTQLRSRRGSDVTGVGS